METGLVFKNTIYQTLARLVSSFVGFLITIIIAGNFGVVGYGDFIKVTSFVAVFYLFVDFGLNAIFLQETEGNFKDLFSIRIILSFAVFILCNVLALILPYSQGIDIGFSNSLKLAIFIFSFSIFTQGIIYSSLYYFQKKLNYFYYLIGIIGGAVFNLILVFIFSYLNFSIFYILISFIFAGLFSSLIFLSLVKEKIIDPHFNKALYKKIFIKSLPLGLMLIFNFIYFRIDTILLSVLSTSNSVGIYGLAYKFFDFLIAVPLFLSNAIYPLLLNARENKIEFKKLTVRYFFIFLLASIVIAIPFWFMSPLFSLIKPQFGLSAIPFKILLLSLPLFFLTSFLQWILIVLQKQKYLMYIYFLSLILNVALNIIYIPKYSYVASAYITVFSEALVFVLLLIKLIIDRKKHYV